MRTPTPGTGANGPPSPATSARRGSCPLSACTTASRTGSPDPRLPLSRHLPTTRPGAKQMSDRKSLDNLVGPQESQRLLGALQRGATRRDILTMLMAGGMQATLAGGLAGTALSV